MTDAGGRALIAHAARFAHLKVLDLTENFLSPEVVHDLGEALSGVEIRAGDQEEEEDDYLFVSVGE